MTAQKARAIGTNNARKLVGVDMKSGHGRRFRALVDSLAVRYAGLDPTVLREVAGLKLTAEICQLAVIEGDRKAAGDLVRTINLLSRREAQLQALAKTLATQAPNLQGYLEGKRVAVAAGDRDPSPLAVPWPMPGNLGGLVTFSTFAEWRSYRGR